jgi:ketosteroid isomerase-like protein
MAAMVIVAGVLLICCLAVGDSRQSPDHTATIVELEQRLAAAWVRGDKAFIEALLAPDWTVTDPSGRVLAKQQVLDEAFLTTDRKIQAMSVDEVKVRLLGDTAVATGRTRATGSYRGVAASVVLRFTDVFVLRDGRWQVVASQGTMVAP